MKKISIKTWIFAICALIAFNTTGAVAVGKNPNPQEKTPATKEYKYESLDNDPMKTRIYTLENGLKVYLSLYKDAPRIQTFIAVRAGSKNDPADATGLAHYLEHMLFKGTDKFGSLDFSKEAPLVQKIEDLYEVYRKTRDEQKRKEIYKQIDSLSGVAANFAIAQEYDKMVTSIGAKGTNAYTFVEQTVYVNDIPSNQIDKWLTIEAERYRNPILRLFHTELEAVYEEKNRSLDNDGSKMWETTFSALWPTHQYGTQTTIGTVEHLKNPSMKEIRNYYQNYYVPNNMAICMSGDFDPDQVIRMIDEKFSGLKPGKIPAFVAPQEAPIANPIVREVIGPDSERVTVAYRNRGAGSKEADLVTLISKILFNDRAGIIDLNLNQSQKVLSAYSYDMILNDYSAHILSGEPKQGQTLEEVKDLLLAQVEKVKKGEFPDWLLSAIINDLKLQQIKMLESNYQRADQMVTSFIADIPWSEYVNEVDRLAQITKQDIVSFANNHYKDNYVVIYKRTGVDKNTEKVTKPQITPVKVNSEDESPFVSSILKGETPEIKPVFLDYKNAIKPFTINKQVPGSYLKNNENGTFNLYYILDMGSNHDKKLGIAVDYLPYLGTSKHTPAQIQEEFFKIGCSFSVFSSEDQVYVSLKGLTENFEKGLQLFEHLLADAQPNKEALENLVSDILKQREDAKLSKRAILWSAMNNYGIYGDKSPFTNILSETELKKLNPEELVSIIKGLNGYQHKVLYYGPQELKSLESTLSKNHKLPKKLKQIPAETKFFQLDNKENMVYVVDYDMQQAEILMVSKAAPFSKELVPVTTLFNEYFGGGMSSILFQEMRESRALAYSVFASYSTPTRKEKPHYVTAYIGTQADKLPEAMKGMFEMFNDMPRSEKKAEAGRNAVIQKINTERITKSNILFNYEKAQKLGLDYDVRKDVYETVQKLTLSDIENFQKQQIKDRKYNILVLGKKDRLDIETLEKYGKVKYLTLEEIFGY
jgi:predicted Zn-dependent peptidase